ncbi:hypothetical protein COCVIDRAFT_23905 [Bipolaris victoriae FI3]|uniref:MATH domain-containing protein n=1 Tax=Bipolaris victoriae (strain FI3) TaxID=930091 RepID=W7EWV3_BIPV3|nr:hypothetical protein COCVIDRAFT_23905 [Bipolaris victoriae FI3]
MSVSVERQPLHFSQQLSSPSRSPTHLLHAHTPTSPQPQPAADMDVSASNNNNTLPPVGQDHDRTDAEMQDGDNPTHRDASTNTVAVEISAIDEDAMDVTPDAEPDALLLNHSSSEAQDSTITTPLSPVPDDSAEALSNAIPPPPVDPGSVPPPAPLNLQPPPPPPPVEPARSDTDSSDEDEEHLPWHPLQEDMSSPDEDELRYIEERGEHSALDHEYWEKEAFKPLEDPEYTAGEAGRIHWAINTYNGTREKPNHEILMRSDVVTIGGHQWQIKFYPKGNDSEYLSVYLECLSVMDPKDKGDQETANDAPTQNVSEPKDEEKSGDSTVSTENTSDFASERREKAGSTPTDAAAPLPRVEYQHAPLPLLGSKKVPKRHSVAAQICVVLYNPTEPRVNYSRNALHRFCSGSPDWGWTRFHGPYFEIPRRMHGQRMALLRDDKLAFTAYIRVVNDETDCLWEHPIRDNIWDSFAMTGLQGLALGEDASSPGGNMISAVATWMLFKPFRQFLYSINVPDPNEEPLVRPKPLVTAFQQVLYMLRTQVDPGAGAVALDDILDALDWYGIHEGLNKLDVIEMWEVLRLKLEEELQDTPHLAKLHAICGPKRDHSSNVPSYRVPVVGVESMQEAVNSSNGFTAPGQPLPELLTIELERHAFDGTKTRSHIKLLNKVTLDDNITVNGTTYTLYGFVVHKQTLQSYVYQPIIRPEGPGSRWYSYSDSKEENQVRCLPKRLAVDVHEGKPGTEQVVGNDPIAYIAMYIRDDVAQSAFVSDAESEQWQVPEWIRLEIENRKSSRGPTPIPTLPTEQSVPEAKPTVEAKPPKTLEFRVIESRVFLKHEGPGLFDAFDSKWADTDSEFIHTVSFSDQDGCKEIRAKLMDTLTGVKDPRQIKFWFLDPMRGSLGRPNLLGTGRIEFSAGSYDQYTDSKEWTLEESPVAYRRIWVHVTDYEKLPELPTEKENEVPELPANDLPSSSSTNQEPQENVVSPQVNGNTAEQPSNSHPPQLPTRVEDTPMSEVEEPVAAQIDHSEPPVRQHEDPLHTEPAQTDDTAMIEVESTPATDPPAVDVVIPSSTPDDTEMGGTQEEVPPLSSPPPPPPPPMDISFENIPPPPEHIQPPPPPPARTPSPKPPADEIYFFLKFWNPEKQALESKGSHVTLKSHRVDETIVALLGLPVEEKKKLEIWEEEDIGTTRALRHRRTFTQLDLHNTSIIIAAMPISAEQKGALAARAAFAEPQAYLKFRSFARNFPHKLNGHFTYNYFSSECYKGEIVNGYRHGHGTLIYHSGAVYNGSFRLNQRHGHGLYTFQNGDTYDGDWVDDQQHGTGTYVEATSGNTYVGGWQNDKKFGEGVTHWKNAQEAERLCRICWDGDAEAAFYDCGHVVACLACAREVQSCPVCRKRVLSAMKLYYVA